MNRVVKCCVDDRRRCWRSPRLRLGSGSQLSLLSSNGKTAVIAGDAAGLKALYSTDPPAQVSVETVAKAGAEADTSFWLGLKARSMKTEIVRNEMRHGHISYIFRAEVQPADGPAIIITDDQSWQQQGDQWRMVAVERTDAPHLKQPSDMKKNIYPRRRRRTRRD